MAAVLACAAFGSICGSSIATAATMAKVALPEMRAINYSGRLATATLAAGGTLGIMIPPSVMLVHLRDPGRAEHRQAVRRGNRAGPDRNRRLLRRHRRLCPAVPARMALRAEAQRGRTAVGVEGRLADRGDLRDRLRRHLWRLVHPDRGRGDRRGGTTFVAGLAARRAVAAQGAHLLLRNRRSLPG